MWTLFVIWVSWHSVLSVPCSLVATCWERVDLFALFYLMFLSLSHMVSWASCGILLYEFLILTFLVLDIYFSEEARVVSSILLRLAFVCIFVCVLVSFPNSAMDWSDVICDRGISRSFGFHFIPIMTISRI